MKSVSLPLLLVLIFTSAWPVGAADTSERQQLYYWLWAKNMEGYWQDFIDFAAAQKMDGVVIWGLKGFGLHGEDRFCRELVKYAHARHVKVIHGLGLNGYEVGQYIVHEDPDLAATIPARFAGTQREKDTRGAVFCPSRPKSLALLKACLLRAADTAIDGFNFETGDVDFLTCHCPDCQRRFDSASETAYGNKPIKWPLAHLKFAAEVLTASHPKLWLNCEFSMPRFGKPPYTQCERLLRLNREIDPRITVVWAENAAPPIEIATRLRKERKNIGFYIRSGAMNGWKEDATHTLKPHKLLPIAQGLLKLDPVCVFYRAYRPTRFWSVNLGVAAAILRRPGMTSKELDRLVADWHERAQ